MSEQVNIKAVWPDWEIEKRIGSGSFGTVYRAKKTVGENTVFSAVKVISIPFADSEVESLAAEGLSINDSIDYYKQLTDDIVKEVSFMESCQGNTNIVGIEDYKVLEQPNAPHYDIFIRMELLTPLNTYLCDKTLDEKEVIKLGIDICNALTVCEKKNIIHRDIKPENIFVNVFGDYKLGDFGIARSLEGMTFGFSQKGTFNYMAPEVFNSSFYDFRADIYSLGIVLYRLLNRNRLPFLDSEKQLLSPSERRHAVERRLKGDEITPIKGVSPELSDIIIKACSYKPEDRFASAGDMKDALERLVKENEEDKTASAKRKSAKRGLWLKILVPVCVLLLVANVVLGILFLGDRKSGNGPETSLTEKELQSDDRSALDRLNAERAKSYSAARNYEKTGQFKKAYNEYDNLGDYMDSEKRAANIANYLKCFDKKQFGAAGEYISVINPDHYSTELVAEYEKLTDVYNLSRNGYFDEAMETLDGLTLIYDYERQSFELTCLFEYVLWLDRAEIVDDIPVLLAKIMREEDWINENWGTGFDGFGEDSHYVQYGDIGEDKTADIRVIYNKDSSSFTEFTFNTNTQDDEGRLVWHFFEITPEGSLISSQKTVDGVERAFVPMDTRVKEPAIEKEETRRAQDILDEANA